MNSLSIRISLLAASLAIALVAVMGSFGTALAAPTQATKCVNLTGYEMCQRAVTYGNPNSPNCQQYSNKGEMIVYRNWRDIYSNGRIVRGDAGAVTVCIGAGYSLPACTSYCN